MCASARLFSLHLYRAPRWLWRLASEK